ncbi:MAG TPA: MAPEG family protein [Roseiarcus sp.]|nr:MAPEG family protein [Roseiarcus sp.]
MTASAAVILGLVAWTLALLILMEALRGGYIIKKAVAANELRPDNLNLSPFMQRLARAHANCVESLPFFGMVLIVALLGNRASVTDPLAPWLLAARVVQSCIHLASLSVLAANLRFAAFVVQVAIGAYWIWRLFEL